MTRDEGGVMGSECTHGDNCFTDIDYCPSHASVDALERERDELMAELSDPMKCCKRCYVLLGQQYIDRVATLKAANAVLVAALKPVCDFFTHSCEVCDEGDGACEELDEMFRNARDGIGAVRAAIAAAKEKP